jgi:hypothetical protein
VLTAATLRHLLLSDAGPELALADVQLVTQDVRPHARTEGLPVRRVRDSGAQYPAVMKGQLEGDMVTALAPRVAYWRPFLVEAETLVVFRVGA